MYKTQLCLGTMSKEALPIEEQILIFKQCGFDAFFTQWDENILKYKAIADANSMIYQSVHAPFLNADKMWKGGDEAAEALAELMRCSDDCAQAGVPIMIVHPYIGFDNLCEVSSIGIENFGKVVERAALKNVCIAFENVEGEEYLAALMEAFAEYQNVGFCWDSGHEICYNKSQDMLSKYGDRLIATHLNDNLGISRFDGSIYWTDDLHLLPFDGVRNWAEAAQRLNRHSYNGILTFELTRFSKPGRYDNDKYIAMDFERYVAECYNRACRFAYMKNSDLTLSKR